LLAFWGAITAADGPGELSKALYCLLNIGLLVAAIILSGQVYAAFGAFGISIYLSHLAGAVFRDSLLFPFALSLIGVAVLAAGLLYRQKQAAIATRLDANLPAFLLRFRPEHHG
jgi:hypothetical protein